MNPITKTIKESGEKFNEKFKILDEPNMREDEVIDFFKNREPYKPTPDIKEWIEWKLKAKS